MWLVACFVLLIVVLVFGILNYTNTQNQVQSIRSALGSKFDAIQNSHNTGMNTLTTRLDNSMADVKTALDTFEKTLSNPYRLKNLGSLGAHELFRLKREVERLEPVVDYQPFSNVCKTASENNDVFATFRANPYVVNMLEHVREDLCEDYRKLIAEFGLDIPWDQVLTNDTVGSPHTITLSDNIQISPTTLRYVFLALKALSAISKTPWRDGVNVIEIGGGYGGQCAITFKLASLFQVTIASYTILDLTNPGLLQNRFLQTQLSAADMSKVQFVNISESSTSNLKKNSFLFSAYAYSEISAENQRIYDERLRGYISNGFVVWNSERSPTIGFYQMVDKTQAQIRVAPEIPQTGPFNYFYEF